LDNSKPTVLLHHGPNGIKYDINAAVDLYLAGHTHGGQLWPATYVAKMMFEYNKGLHDYKGTQVYVSQGTGTFGPPMRVGTYSELTILNLKPESS
jgi:predicted MPP superfamily phosphohydrolase